MKICKKCKKKNSDKAVKCKYCGNKNFSKQNTPQIIKAETVKKKAKIISTDKTEILFAKEIKEEKLNLQKKDIMSDKTEVLFPKKEKVSDKTEILFEKDKKVSDKTELLFPKVKKEKKISKKEQKIIEKEKIDNQITDLFNNQVDLSKEEPEILFGDQLNLLNNSITRANQLETLKRKTKKKKITKIFITIIFILAMGVLIYEFLPNINNSGYKINVEKENSKRIFKIGETINYKNVKFTVLSVKTSMGTKYKKPKEGNQFLIITIDFVNKSKDDYTYNANDWTMTNSLGEESFKVITPINAKDALYKGKLVVGGSKTASLVFEQPIGDLDLKLNYYDCDDCQSIILEQNSKDEEEDTKEQEDVEIEETSPIIEKPIPIFSIVINIPEADTAE